jgi:hypothetical protein
LISLYLTVRVAYNGGLLPKEQCMQIQGIEGMTTGQLQFELQRGAKFVFYYYCVSVLVITFRRPSGIYFLRAGESSVAKGVPWTLLTFVAGWWGTPWGPIYSIQSLVINFKGGKDVTAEVARQLNVGLAVTPTT